MTDVRNFQTGSPQLLPWNDRLCAHRLSAGGIGHLFCGAEPGLRPAGLWLLYAVQHHFYAAVLFSGADHALLCGGTPHPHRPAPAHQSGAGDGHRAGQVLCPVRGVCTALRGGRSHDPDPAGTGGDRCQYAGQFCGAAVLLSAGLRRHCHRGVPVQPDRKPDHRGGGRSGGAAAGLSDAQPAQDVHHRQCRGAGVVHRTGRGAQCGGGPAQPQLHAGVFDLCRVLCGAHGVVPAAQQLADRGLQRRAERTVPVCSLCGIRQQQLFHPHTGVLSHRDGAVPVLYRAGTGKTPLELRGGHNNEKQKEPAGQRQGIPQWGVLHRHSGGCHPAGGAGQSGGAGTSVQIHGV